MTWRLEIPQPTDWINANQRLHWAVKARRTKAWKDAADILARHSTGYFVEPVRIVATIHKARGGRWDAHNLAPTVKAAIDGLVAAGVLADDNNEYVTGVEFRAGEKGSPRLVLELIPETEQS